MSEKLYSLSEAYERATGLRPHPSTCHRHRIRGVSGIRLETVRVGGRRLCSVEAVLRFNAAVTAATDSTLVSARIHRNVEKAVKQAEAALDRAGI